MKSVATYEVQTSVFGSFLNKRAGAERMQCRSICCHALACRIGKHTIYNQPGSLAVRSGNN
jgi:hypothetical protein